MIVNVPTTNPIKVRAVRAAFRRCFPRVRVRKVTSARLSPRLPEGLRTIQRLARRRAERAWGNCDYAVGIESGLVDGMMVTLCVVTDGKTYARGGSPFFELPDRALLRRRQKGAISTMTGGRIQRVDLTEWAVRMALARMLHTG